MNTRVGQTGLALAAGLSAIGCMHAPLSKLSFGDVKPDASRQGLQNLTVAGSHFPIQLIYVMRGGRVEIQIVRGKTVLEKEEYIESPAAFSLSEGGEERYRPCVPLLQFPFSIGSKTEWTGQIIGSGIEQSANATVTSTSERVSYKGTSHHMIRVDVSLSLQLSSSIQPVHRELKFWFDIGHGIAMRDFGGVSIRSPIGYTPN